MVKKNQIIIFLVIFISIIFSQKNDYVFIQEDFKDLKSWRPLTFPKIESHSEYEINKKDTMSYLRAISDSSASGLIFKKTFNVYDYPIVEWKWKVKNILEKGDATLKEGDDYPLRIYIIFQYDPDEAGLFEKAQYNAAKILYGEYPPHSSLNYIWANRKQDSIITNPFVDKAKMIPLRHGKKNVDRWMKEKINIMRDYKRAFDEKPPQTASLAIMSDSDNTGGTARGFLDYIKVIKE